MRRLFLCCAVVMAVAAAGTADAATSRPGKIHHAPNIQTRDWTSVVTATPAGGFVMGNPNARVKLIEFGSMTCPHCREFDAMGVPHLLAGYVEKGEVSWEFRNYVRDAFDVTASLVARCDGAKSFFPLTRALYKDQDSWVAKVRQTPEDKLSPIHDLPPSREFVALANVAGFQQWGARHGVPVARSNQCLGKTASVEQLVQMASNAEKQFPDFKGTPSFVINGTLVDFGPITAEQVWPTLESKIQAALSGAS